MNDKLKSAKTTLTKQTEDIKNAFKAEKAKFAEAKSASSNDLKTKIASLTKNNSEELAKIDAKHADTVKSFADKLAKENAKKAAKLEKLEQDYNKALEVPRGIIQEYKNFQIEADKNENERHSKITSAHKAENKKAVSDVNKHDTNLKSTFEKDTKEFNDAILSLDNNYAENQKEQTSKTNKLLSDVKLTFTKAQNSAEKNMQSLTEEYNNNKTDLSSQLSEAGANKSVANALKKKITSLTKTYNTNIAEVKAKLASEKVIFEKETLSINKENSKVMEELRVNYINDKIKLEKEIKEKELRLETDLLNSTLKLGTIESNTELTLLSDENRLQLLMHKLTFEMQETKILENYADVTAGFELNKTIVELDNEVQEIEARLLLAKSELEIQLKKKQDSTKLALEIQKLEYAQESKVLADKLVLDLKEAKMNFELTQKETEFKALEFKLKDEEAQQSADDFELQLKSLSKTYEAEKIKLQSENKRDFAALNSKNTFVINKINSELVAFEKEINDKIAKAENTKNAELKDNNKKRSNAQATYDKTLANSETAKLEKYQKFKSLIDEMQLAQNALASEILAMTSKDTKIRNSYGSKIAKNEADFLNKVKANAAAFEKKRKSLIASKKA